MRIDWNLCFLSTVRIIKISSRDKRESGNLRHPFTMRVCLVLLSLCLAITLIPVSRGETDLDEHESDDCNLRNGSCRNCTDGADDCFWCEASKECKKWTHGNNHLSKVDCKGYNFYYQQCKLNGAGIIAITAVVLVLLVASCVCCCVCCCCCWLSRRRKRNYELLQDNYADKKAEIYERNADRKAERKARRDDIRRKYALNPDDTQYA